MTPTLRDYQRAAVESVFHYWRAGGGSPLIEMATGTGKSIVVAEIMRTLLEHWPDMRIINLVHVQELVAQNWQQLLRIWPEAPAGVYSAGLNRRDVHSRVLFASIQSVYKKAEIIGPRDVILIDEAHLVPHEAAGMYRTFISGLQRLRPDLRLAGLTATPYRLSSGRIDKGVGALFSDIVYTYGIAEGIKDGYLSPLTCRAAETEIDVKNVAKRGGEFVAGALEAAAMQGDLVRDAAAEIVKRGLERRSWLCFCTGVKHARATRDALRDLGVSAECVTGDTPKPERARILEAFKRGEIRALTNAQVLTTGFDAPGVDLVAFLRPTLSTGLYVQMVGRGTRKADGKANCLILDFAGNVRRHGPVDAIEGVEKSKKGSEEFKVKEETVRARECDSCGELNPLNVRNCRACGYEMIKPKTPEHETKPDSEAVILTSELRKQPKRGERVASWAAYVHTKTGSKPTMRVEYRAGLMMFREWICFEHSGPPRMKAQQWWIQHGGDRPIPDTTCEALERFETLECPTEIVVQRSKENPKYANIVGRSFADADEGVEYDRASA